MTASRDPAGPLTGRHALITGAGRGIGAVIAARLAREGARTSLLGRERASLERVALESGGSDRARSYATDVTDGAAVRDAFSAARAAVGPVHSRVNNAGQAASAKFTDTDESLWTRLLAVNLTGTYLCTREAITDMLQAGFGRIVNVASTAGLGGAPYLAAYCASKHGVIGFTRAMAAELAKNGVTVNAVCPGYTETEMMHRAVANITARTQKSADEARELLAQGNPGGRIATAEEVALAVVELIEDTQTGAAVIIPK